MRIAAKRRTASVRSPRRLRLLSIGTANVVALLLVVAGIGWPHGAEATVPTSFTDTVVASISAPTDLAFTPAGDLYATTQGGVLYKVTGGLAIALDLRGKVDSYFERGLLGVTFDPNFATNKYVYVYYSRYKSSAVGGAVNRVSRFNLTTGLSSETVLIDNIPSPNGNHNAGDLEIGADGYLYVSIGDGGCAMTNCSLQGGQNTNARRKDIPSGKIFRITTAGGVPSSNPFASSGADCRVNGSSGTAGVHCRETYSWGLRNPFRIAFNPAKTTFYINDVGQNAYEEIDIGQSGADYGWSCKEGNAINQGCSGTFTNPYFVYGRGGGCGSITGGAFVPAGLWSSTYDGAYLYADYVCGRIYSLKGGVATTFASGLGGPTSMVFGPASTKALYYTAYGNGQIRKITYTGVSNSPPVAKITADKRFGALPLVVQFTSAGSTDPNSNPLTFTWNFGDGSPTATGASVQHTYTTAQDFTATLTANDGRGGTNQATVKIMAGDLPPVPQISAPLLDDEFSVGQVITLTGLATDPEDGALADSKLTWEVIKHHDTHTHPFLQATTGNNLQITAPPPEDLLAATNSYLEIRLTAVDSRGVTTTISQNLMPKKVELTVGANVSYAQVQIEGISYRTPAVFITWAQNPIDLAIGDTISPSGQPARWVSWSDAGDRNHQIITPDAPATYTASFEVDSAPAYIAIADTRVQQSTPTTNFGSDPLLVASKGTAAINSLLRFNLQGVPSGFQSATLYLFVKVNSTNGPSLYYTTGSWSESTVTWNTRPATVGGVIGTYPRILSNTWVALDVTAAVSGDGTVNFMLTGDTGLGGSFASRNTPGREPRLVLHGAVGDGEAPSTPANLSGDAESSSRVNLTWDASTDTNGIASYDVLRNGVLVATTVTPAFVDNSVNAATTFSYVVVARDGSGQTSTPSDQLEVTTPDPTTTFTFAPNADAFVFASKPTENFGTRSYLQTRGTSVLSYIRVPVQGLVGPVYKAVLRVYATEGTDDGPAVYKTTTSTWSETTITFATKLNPLPGAPADDVGAVVAGTWIEYDVTSMIAGNGAITFMLRQQSGDASNYAPRESATPPQLIVTAFQSGGAPSMSAEISTTETAVPTVTPTAPASPTPTPLALPFADGFESGDLAGWTTVGEFAVNQETVAAGAWAARASGTANGTGSSATLPLNDDLREVYVRTKFKVDPSNANDTDLLTVLDEQLAPVVTALVDADGELAVRFDQLGKVRIAMPIEDALWHEIQLHLRIAGEVGLLELWLDGDLVKQIEFSVLDRPVRAIRLGDTRGDRVFQASFDDVAVDIVCIGSCSSQLVTPEPSGASATATTTSQPTPAATTEVSPTVEQTPSTEATVTPTAPVIEEPTATAEPTLAPEPSPTPEPTAVPEATIEPGEGEPAESDG